MDTICLVRLYLKKEKFARICKYDSFRDEYEVLKVDKIVQRY